MLNKKLTDFDLRELYFRLVNQYVEYQRNIPGMSHEQIKEDMLQQVFSPFGSFSDYSWGERQKICAVIDALMTAFANIRRPSYAFAANNNLMQAGHINPIEDHCEAIKEFHDKTNNQDDLMIHMGLVFATFGFYFVIYAAYYLFNEISNAVERIWYAEGLVQAALTLLALATIAYTSAYPIAFIVVLTLLVASLSLGFTANPVPLIILSATSLFFIFTAMGTYITNSIQNMIIPLAHSSALDPADPFRFTITNQEETKLRQLNIDPLKAKLAIIALRAEIGGQLPSFFNRTEYQQECLRAVRAIRNGELSQVVIKKELVLDLTLEEQIPIQYQQHDNNYQPQFYRYPPQQQAQSVEAAFNLR
ncbi:MAG: hypothetical protein ACOVQX_00840 [Legionella sp.]